MVNPATWKSWNATIPHNQKNADHLQQHCYKIELQQTNFISYSIAYSIGEVNQQRSLFIKIMAMSEMMTEIAMELGVEVEQFIPLPKPHVRLFGAAANAGGRPLANLVEMTASRYHYLVVVELPQVQFCESEVEWTVNEDSEVTIEGQITPAAIFADKPVTGNKRNRVQLCPTQPWAISFYFPGPVDWWTTSVLFTSKNVMEISVMKEISVTEIVATGSSLAVPEPEIATAGFTPAVSVPEIAAAGSTAAVAAAGPGPSGERSLTPAEIVEMVNGWFV